MNTPEKTAYIKKLGTFNLLPSYVVDEIIVTSEVVYKEPHEIVWNQDSDERLQFQVVLDGSIAVWERSGNDETLDALVIPGQVIGEFDLFHHRSKAFELHTLSETKLLLISDEMLSRLNVEYKEKFFEKIIHLLIDKLIAQNALLKIRAGQVEKRLAKFFAKFAGKDWRCLTSLKSAYSMDGFEINLFFDRSVLMGLTDSTKLDPILLALKSMVKNQIVEISVFDEQFRFRKILPDADLCKKGDGSLPINRYYRFKIQDYTGLCNIIGVPGL